MAQWSVGNIWWDHVREILKFKLINEVGKEFLCGVTRIAINDHYRSGDTEIDAEKNFENNKGSMIALAEKLILQKAADKEGLYLITSKILSG